MDLRSLPGHELIEKGLSDLASERERVEALVVAIGAERLRHAGIAVPPRVPTDPEKRLYALLSKNEPDSAHSRYNALIRQLVSFERAAECAA
jgi:hypothetical protein